MRTSKVRMRATCAVMVAVGMLSAPLDAVYGQCGPVTASGSQTLTNNSLSPGVCTGVRFTYQVKSGYVHDCWFWSYNDNIKRNGQPLPYDTVSRTTVLDDSNRVYSVTATYDGVDTPTYVNYGESVTVNASVTMYGDQSNCCNCFELVNVTFLYEAFPPYDIQAVPSTSFEFPEAVPPGQVHDVPYIYANMELALARGISGPITLTNVRFYQDDVWYPAEDQWETPGVLIHEEPGPIEVWPESSEEFLIPDVLTMDPSYIYVVGTMEYEVSEFDPATMMEEFRHGHQECVAAPPIPTVSEWGLIIMTLLLLTAGTIIFGRLRHRRPATT